MKNAEDLRARAGSIRQMAATARRVGRSLSLPPDRSMLLEHARELEAEAAGLEAQADVLERAPASGRP